MLPHIHPPILSLHVPAPYIHSTFSFCRVAAYNNTVYTRHFSILSCLRVYTLLLYAAHFHLVVSPRMHPHIIRGTLPSWHAAAYTPSYYTRHIFTLTCRRVCTLLSYAAPCHPGLPPRIYSLIIRGRFPSRHVTAYTPSYYTRQISILSCLHVCTLLLYAAPCHPVMPPRILSLIIRGRFTSCHVAAYTPSYYTRHLAILSCRRVYSLLLYAVDLHPVMSPRIHPLIIRGTLPSWHAAAYTLSYYTR